MVQITHSIQLKGIFLRVRSSYKMNSGISKTLVTTYKTTWNSKQQDSCLKISYSGTPSKSRRETFATIQPSRTTIEEALDF